MPFPIRAAHPRRFALPLALAGALAAPLAAHAVTLVWQNAAGGAASNAANWNPAQVPTVADLLRFDLANTYTVTLNGTVDSVQTHQIFGGDVTLSPSVLHNVGTGFHVASTAGLVATARLLSGDMRFGWSTSVGAGTGATGTLRLSGGTVNVTQNTFGASGEGPVVNIAGSGTTSAGTGELVVINGASFTPAFHVNVGRNAGSLGTLRVRGAGATGSGTRRAQFLADSATADCRLGRSGGHGILEVQDGGLFRIGRNLVVAEGASDIGDVTITGKNVIDSSTVKVKGSLKLAYDPASGAAGGTGTITLDSLGVLVVDDSTIVGDPDGSSGTITIQPDSRMRTKHLILQQPAGSTVDLQGGLLQVDGGTFSTFTNRLTIPGGATDGNDTPKLQLMNGAAATFTGATATPPLIVASTGGAVFDVLGGADVVANGGNVIAAQNAGSVAQVDVYGAGSTLSTNRTFVVGSAGQAYVAVDAGGIVSTSGVNVGETATGSGTLLLTGAGSMLNSTGAFNVAGSTLAQGNYGTVVVNDGATLNLLAPVVAGTIWKGPGTPGTIGVLTNATVNVQGAMTVRGNIELDSGTWSGGSLLLRDTGIIVGGGTVSSSILAGTDTTVMILAGGALDLGRDTGNGDVLIRGLLDVGPNVVTIHDPDSAIVGVVELSGGELHLPAGGGVLESGKRLVGDGTIFGPFTPRGDVITSGAGLKIAGTMYGTGASTSGTLVQFLAGARFDGAGAMDCAVTVDSGAVVHATDQLVLGRLWSPNDLTLRGRIEGPRSRVLALQQASNTSLYGEVVLDNTTLTGGSGFAFNVETSGRLSGAGSLTQNLVVKGRVAPGTGARKISTSASLSMSNGTLEVELGNHATSEYDTLKSTHAFLGGTLELKLLPSFNGVPGDSFTVIQCTGIVSGTFANVTVQGEPLNGRFGVVYNGNSVVVVVLLPILGVEDHTPAPSTFTALRFAPLGSPGASPVLALDLPVAANVSVRVYDVTGREVAVLADGALGAGAHRLPLSRDLPGAGLYFVRARVDDGSRIEVRKASVVRLR